jgi:anti-anti-sigma factor
MHIDSASFARRADPTFTLSVSRRGRHRVVRVCGELDIAARDHVRQACLDGPGNVVVVEMAQTTFMDCSGYGALVGARLMLNASGGSLTLHHQTGQPAELLDMLAGLH